MEIEFKAKMVRIFSHFRVFEPKKVSHLKVETHGRYFEVKLKMNWTLRILCSKSQARDKTSFDDFLSHLKDPRVHRLNYDIIPIVMLHNLCKIGYVTYRLLDMICSISYHMLHRVYDIKLYIRLVSKETLIPEWLFKTTTTIEPERIEFNQNNKIVILTRDPRTAWSAPRNF